MGLCISPVTYAASIILVTENLDTDVDGTPDDQGLVDFLTGLGHEVDAQRGNWNALDAAKISQLNAADLVVVSRSTTSGYRWYWVNSTTINNLTAPRM